MQERVLYYRLDCLDVLETMEDNTFSLIYLEVPFSERGRSERIMRETLFESEDRMAGMFECKDVFVSTETYSYHRERQHEKYMFKIVQNCYRVLKDRGIIVFKELHNSGYCDILKYFLKNLFYGFGTKIVGENNDFQIMHFYSKVDCYNALWGTHYLKKFEKLPCIMKGEKFFEKIFSVFTIKNDKVLGIYEGQKFACCASAKHLSCFLVISKFAHCRVSEIQQSENLYTIVEKLGNHKVRVYEEKIPLMIDVEKEQKAFIDTVIKENKIKEGINAEIGSNVNEILLFHIEKYMKIMDMSESKFTNLTGVNKQTVWNIKNAVREVNKFKKNKKILKLSVEQKRLF